MTSKPQNRQKQTLPLRTRTAGATPGHGRCAGRNGLCATAGGVLLLTLACLGFEQIAMVGGALAQTTTKPPQARPAPQPAPRPQPPAAASAKDGSGEPFIKHASDAGVRVCAPTYAALGNLLTNGTQYMVQTQTGKTEADRHALQGVVGMNFKSDKGYSGPAAGLVFAAPVGNACEGTLVRIVPFQQNCQSVTAALPPNSPPQQELAGLQNFQLSTGGQALLLPSGQGCVVISVVRAGG